MCASSQRSTTQTTATHPGTAEEPESVTALGTSPVPQPQPRLPTQHHPETGDPS